MLIANSLLVPNWATPEHFRELEDDGPDDVRPDDRGLVDLHRHPGHPAGHLRDLRRGRRPALRRHAGRHDHPHRRARRHGRRAAAGGHRQRRRGAVRRGRPVAGPAPARARLPRRDRRLARRRHRPGRGGEAGAPGAVGRPWSATRADVFPSWWRRGWAPDVVTDQTSAHDALNGYVPHGMSLERGARAAARQARRSTSSGRRESMAEHCRAMVDLQRAGAVVFDYGNGLRGAGPGRGLRRRLRLPGLRARLHPAAVRPRRRTVPVGLPVRRRRRPRGDRPGRAEGVPGRRPAAALGAVRRREGQGPGPAVADLLARVRRAARRRARRSTTWSPPVRSRRRS